MDSKKTRYTRLTDATWARVKVSAAMKNKTLEDWLTDAIERTAAQEEAERAARASHR